MWSRNNEKLCLDIKNIKDELPAALAGLPDNAWPDGRIIFLITGKTEDPDIAAMININKSNTVYTLNKLNINIHSEGISD